MEVRCVETVRKIGKLTILKSKKNNNNTKSYGTQTTFCDNLKVI